MWRSKDDTDLELKEKQHKPTQTPVQDTWERWREKGDQEQPSALANELLRTRGVNLPPDTCVAKAIENY